MDSGSARVSSRSAITRARILDSAATVFKTQGYTQAKLADIAAGAGIQAGSLYYHFDSREALVEEMLHIAISSTWDHVKQAVAACGDQATSLDRLIAAIHAQVASVLEVNNFAAANARITDQVPPDVRRRVYASEKVVGEYWQDLLQAAQRRGEVRDDLDPYKVRMLLLGSMNMLWSWYRPTRQTAEDVSGTLVAMVMDGLRPRA